MALAVLSTRGLFFLKVIWFSLLASGADGAGGGGGGGASTFTDVVDEADKLRSSVAVQLTVIEPGCAPAVLSVALASLPEIVPELAV